MCVSVIWLLFYLRAKFNRGGKTARNVITYLKIEEGAHNYEDDEFGGGDYFVDADNDEADDYDDNDINYVNEAYLEHTFSCLASDSIGSGSSLP